MKQSERATEGVSRELGSVEREGRRGGEDEAAGGSKEIYAPLKDDDVGVHAGGRGRMMEEGRRRRYKGLGEDGGGGKEEGKVE